MPEVEEEPENPNALPSIGNRMGNIKEALNVFDEIDLEKEAISGHYELP